MITVFGGGSASQAKKIFICGAKLDFENFICGKLTNVYFYATDLAPLPTLYRHGIVQLIS